MPEDTEDLLSVMTRLAELTAKPFAPEVVQAHCGALGWEVFREDFWPEGSFEVRIPGTRFRFIACFDDSETSVCLSVCALLFEGEPYLEDEGEPRQWVETAEDFDATFKDVLSQAAASLGPPAKRGTYTDDVLFAGDDEPMTLHFAAWPGEHAILLMLQHGEGDANFGHAATIDIRLLPWKPGDPFPELPLTTNVIC